MAPGAIHDSADRRDAPKCHPRTREAVIHDVLKWAWSSSSRRLLMWIYGPAGAGKSAIMQTIAEICQETGTLGASFFFLRGADRRNIADHLVATLAYQLARRVPHFCDYLAETIHEDPSIFSRNLTLQMKGLILDPMVSASKHDPNSSEWIFVVIIDGLDECASEDTHREVVNLLANSASSPFRFLIASRPEFKIRNTFSQPDNLDKTQMLALDN